MKDEIDIGVLQFGSEFRDKLSTTLESHQAKVTTDETANITTTNVLMKQNDVDKPKSVHISNPAKSQLDTDVPVHDLCAADINPSPDTCTLVVGAGSDKIYSHEVTDRPQNSLPEYGTLLNLFYRELLIALKEHKTISLTDLIKCYPELKKSTLVEWLKILVEKSLFNKQGRNHTYSRPNNN